MKRYSTERYDRAMGVAKTVNLALHHRLMIPNDRKNKNTSITTSLLSVIVDNILFIVVV